MSRSSAAAVLLATGGLLIVRLAYVLATRPAGARWMVAVAGGFLLVASALVRPRAAALGVLTWLPFMAFFRRAIYVLSPYTSLDPILLVAPATCGLIVSVALVGAREQIVEALRRSYTSR